MSMQTDLMNKLNTTHGMSKTPQFHVWQAMLQRCSNPNNPRYHCYGGKGITVCDKWKTFEGFWEDNEPYYKSGLTIDRTESDKGYNPDNVQWITHAANSSKTCRSRPVTCVMLIDGEVFKEDFDSLLQAATITGTPLTTLNRTLRNKRYNDAGQYWAYTEDVCKLDFVKIFSTPRKRSTHSGRSKKVKFTSADDSQVFSSVAEAAEKVGCSKSTIQVSLRTGKKTRNGFLWEYAKESLTEISA